MKSEYGERKTWKHTKRHLKRTHRGFLDSIETRIDELNPDDKDRRRFKALCGTLPMEGPIRGSDLVAHYHFAHSIAKEVRDLAQASDDLNFYFLTLLADEGIMSDRTPKYMRRTLMGKASKAMAKAGLDGIFLVETQALTNYPQHGDGRALLAHVHALGWKPKGAPNNSAVDIKRELGSGRGRRNESWTSKLGADPIVVREITEDLGCPSYWVAYLLKAPHDAKNLVQPSEHAMETFPAPKAKFKSTTSGYRPELAMRLFELFAQLPLSSMVGGTGSGAVMLARCRTLLRLWSEQRIAKWQDEGVKCVQPFDERKFWKRTHQRRRARYRRFFIDGPTLAVRSIKRRV